MMSELEKAVRDMIRGGITVPEIKQEVDAISSRVSHETAARLYVNSVVSR